VRTLFSVSAKPSLLNVSSTCFTKSGRCLAFPNSDALAVETLDRSVPALMSEK
jgi:hypothetical protein